MTTGTEQNGNKEQMPDTNQTAGVSLLLGDPKRAIVRLSGPMIVAMLLYTSYNLVNAIWVAGLGSDELAAVGFISPLFLMIVGLGNGLGAGTTSVIARRIGREDHDAANNAAIHGIIISLIISIILTIPLIIFVTPIALLFGAGETARLAGEYGKIIFGGTILLLLTNIGSAILRAEGDTKRAMYIMGASAILNMILDPILIYQAGMGIAGAAWGMIISQIFVVIVLAYWFFVKRNSYVQLSAKSFIPDRKTTSDILGVGLPASVEFFLMSIVAIIINWLLVLVSGTDAVAVYAAGWRIVMFAIIPLAGIGVSVVSVTGAAFGGRKYEKLPVIHSFSITLGVIIAVITSLITWFFAPQIASIFTYSPESTHLAPSIAAFLATMCFFYPFVPPGIMSGSLFQGVGKGMTSLIITLLRNLIFIVICAYYIGIILGYGELGVWWGIVAGDIMGGLVSYTWARVYIKTLLKYR